MLLLAAVHSIVLAGTATSSSPPGYPTVTGAAAHRRPVPVLRGAVPVARRRDRAPDRTRSAPRPTRSGAAPCCSRHSAIVAARGRRRSASSTSAPAPGSTCCSTGTAYVLRARRARWVTRRRSRSSPALAATCPLPAGLPSVAARIGIDPFADRPHRRRPGAVAARRACGPTSATVCDRLRRGDRDRRRPTRPTCAAATPSTTSPAASSRLGATGHPVVLNTWVLNYLAPRPAARLRGRARSARRRPRPVVGVRRGAGAVRRDPVRRRPPMASIAPCSRSSRWRDGRRHRARPGRRPPARLLAALERRPR